MDVSFVIPVYNERAILERAVGELTEGLASLDATWEIWLAENGSTDGTRALCSELAARCPGVRTLSVGEPNYGLALREGIARADGDIVICEEIDLCDLGFHRRALDILRHEPVDMVIGSKLIAGAEDERPWLRHAASLAYNGLLRATLGFPGTDTHGLKAFRRATVGPVAGACVVDRDVFASELVIRAYRAGLTVREIPVSLHEKRPTSINLVRRVPGVVSRLARLTWAIRGAGR